MSTATRHEPCGGGNLDAPHDGRDLRMGDAPPSAVRLTLEVLDEISPRAKIVASWQQNAQPLFRSQELKGGSYLIETQHFRPIVVYLAHNVLWDKPNGVAHPASGGFREGDHSAAR
jgi:hypothetical protein